MNKSRAAHSADIVYPPELIDNLPDHQDERPKTCTICLDDGIVNLIGTIRTGNGPTYERGVAACQWCRIGYRRAYVWRKMGTHVLEEYTLDDVEPPVAAVNWHDSAERLRQTKATEDGLRAMRDVLSTQARRGRELAEGFSGPPDPAATPDAFAGEPAAERPFG